MKKDSLSFLCCPSCLSDLTLNEEQIDHDEVTFGTLLCLSCSKEYPIADGIPDFLLSEFLNEKDRKWMLEYDSMARSYDIIMSYLVPLISVGQASFERYRWVKALHVKKGAHILDVSTGTGFNLRFMRRLVGSNGRLAALDISKGMLTYAQAKTKRKGWKNIEFHRANASYLPYKSDTFDGVIHVGGINTFGEKKRALHEMVRVAKEKAKIIIVDEGLASEKQRTFLGKFQLRTNRLYFCQPSTRLLPNNIKNLRVTWKTDPFWPHYIMELQKA